SSSGTSSSGSSSSTKSSSSSTSSPTASSSSGSPSSSSSSSSSESSRRSGSSSRSARPVSRRYGRGGGILAWRGKERCAGASGLRYTSRRIMRTVSSLVATTYA